MAINAPISAQSRFRQCLRFPCILTQEYSAMYLFSRSISPSCPDAKPIHA
jgi:hypothetical protein